MSTKVIFSSVSSIAPQLPIISPWSIVNSRLKTRRDFLSFTCLESIFTPRDMTSRPKQIAISQGRNSNHWILLSTLTQWKHSTGPLSPSTRSLSNECPFNLGYFLKITLLSLAVCKTRGKRPNSSALSIASFLPLLLERRWASSHRNLVKSTFFC